MICQQLLDLHALGPVGVVLRPVVGSEGPELDAVELHRVQMLHHRGEWDAILGVPSPDVRPGTNGNFLLAYYTLLFFIILLEFNQVCTAESLEHRD